MTREPDGLAELLPQWHRLRDAEAGEPLRALLAVIAEQVDRGTRRSRAELRGLVRRDRRRLGAAVPRRPRRLPHAAGLRAGARHPARRRETRPPLAEASPRAAMSPPPSPTAAARAPSPCWRSSSDVGRRAGPHGPWSSPGYVSATSSRCGCTARTRRRPTRTDARPRPARRRTGRRGTRPARRPLRRGAPARSDVRRAGLPPPARADTRPAGVGLFVWRLKPYSRHPRTGVLHRPRPQPVHLLHPRQRHPAGHPARVPEPSPTHIATIDHVPALHPPPSARRPARRLLRPGQELHDLARRPGRSPCRPPTSWWRTCPAGATGPSAARSRSTRSSAGSRSAPARHPRQRRLGRPTTTRSATTPGGGEYPRDRSHTATRDRLPGRPGQPYRADHGRLRAWRTTAGPDAAARGHHRDHPQRRLPGTAGLRPAPGRPPRTARSRGHPTGRSGCSTGTATGPTRSTSVATPADCGPGGRASSSTDC